MVYYIMKRQCGICNNNIPNWIKVNGKDKNLSSRKYCLTCSPYNKHNTKKLIKSKEGKGIISIKESYTMKICPKCKDNKLLKDYYLRRNDKDTSVYCKVCTNEQSINRQKYNKQKAVDYLGGKCSHCNYSKYLGALEFHHKDPSKKDFTIARFKCRSFDSIKSELDKCILLCANCHREEHFRLTSLVV